METSDYSGKNLCRQSFAQKHLAHAVFKTADLRGTDFSGADLQGADFSGARLGMKRSWVAVIVLLALTVSVLIGAASGMLGRQLRALILNPESRPIGIILAISAVAFLVSAAWIGIGRATRTVLVPFVVTSAALALGFIIAGLGTGKNALTIFLFAVACFALVGLGALARVVGGTAGMICFVIIALAGAVFGGLLGGGLLATAIAVTSMLIGRRALKADTHYAQLQTMSNTIACAGGTHFRGADLSGADFSSAKLISCDFRGATLAGARFDRAQSKYCLFDRDIDAPPSRDK
jgi:hypothetical protein